MIHSILTQMSGLRRHTFSRCFSRTTWVCRHQKG